MSNIKRKRYPVVALALAMMGFGGLGQLYNGEGKKGLLVLSASCFIQLAPFFIDTSLGLITFLVLSYSFLGGTMLDAFLVAWRRKEISLKWYNKWYIYLAIALSSTLFSSPVSSYFSLTRPLKAYRIVSDSMMPTLVKGDLVMVDLDYYKKHPLKRGDIVAYRHQSDPTAYLHRVVGLPGDTIDIEGTKVFINGEPHQEHYASYASGGVMGGRFIVSNEKLFVLGDNRDKSRDSRFQEDKVTMNQVVGKVLFIYWGNAGWSRIGTSFD